MHAEHEDANRVPPRIELPEQRDCARYDDRHVFFFFQAEDGIRDLTVTGVQTCALPISGPEEVDRSEADDTDLEGKGEHRLDTERQGLRAEEGPSRRGRKRRLQGRGSPDRKSVV